MAFAEATHGGVDVLVNNASGPGYHPEAPLEYWLETVQTDLLGSMCGTRHAIDYMHKRGGGAIVNIGSTSALAHGRVYAGGSPAYDVAKSGTIRITTMLGWLKTAENIRVNCLAPDCVGRTAYLRFSRLSKKSQMPSSNLSRTTTLQAASWFGGAEKRQRSSPLVIQATPMLKNLPSSVSFGWKAVARWSPSAPMPISTPDNTHCCPPSVDR